MWKGNEFLPNEQWITDRNKKHYILIKLNYLIRSGFFTHLSLKINYFQTIHTAKTLNQPIQINILLKHHISITGSFFNIFQNSNELSISE